MNTEGRNEKLLDAWLRLSTVLSNDRIVTDMPYNEALICHILSDEGDGLTATVLCERTKMLKSQMNRTLNSMEEKGLILRERSEVDRRRIHIVLNEEKRFLFEREHQKNLRLVDAILARYGEERGEALAGELMAISEIIEEVLEK